jgi:hypothetical protein
MNALPFSRFFICVASLTLLTANITFGQSRYPQYPYKVLAVKGTIQSDGQALLRGDALNYLQNIRFNNTADVVVVLDRYQRSFYVMPTAYTSAESGNTCDSEYVNCTPIAKDALGNVVMTFPDNSRANMAAPAGKSDAAAAPVVYHYAATRYPVYSETSVVEHRSATPSSYKLIRYKN